MKQLTGVDFAENGDLSAVSAICENCGYVIESQTFEKSEIVKIPVYQKCPVCGVKFDKHLIFE